MSGQTIFLGLPEFSDLPSTSISAANLGISEIDLNITSSCTRTQHCRHCYLTQQFLLSGQKMSLAMVTAIVERAKRSRINNPGGGVTTFNLLGGEPSMHPQFVRIVEIIAEAGFQVHVVTNGDLVFRRQLNRPLTRPGRESQMLGESGLISYVAVSFEGDNDEDHDLIRGPGSFDAAMNTVLALKNRGIPFGINWTVLSNTAHLGISMIQFAEEIGAQRLNVHVISIRGTARERAADQLIEPHRWFDIWADMWNAAVCEQYRPEGQRLQIDCEANFEPELVGLGWIAYRYQHSYVKSGLCNVRRPKGITFFPDGAAILCPLHAESPELSGYLWRNGGLYRRNDPNDEIAQVAAAGNCPECPLYKGEMVSGHRVLCVLNRVSPPPRNDRSRE